jgi:hypothetical protein
MLSFCLSAAVLAVVTGWQQVRAAAVAVLAVCVQGQASSVKPLTR